MFLATQHFPVTLGCDKAATQRLRRLLRLRIISLSHANRTQKKDLFIIGGGGTYGTHPWAEPCWLYALYYYIAAVDLGSL